MRYKYTVRLSQDSIPVQGKWGVRFRFSAELTRYPSALRVELLGVFNQTEDSRILLAGVEATIRRRLTGGNARGHGSLTGGNARRHSSLAEAVKSLPVWHEVVCSQPGL